MSCQLSARFALAIDHPLQQFFALSASAGSATMSRSTACSRRATRSALSNSPAPYADFGSMKIINAALYMSARPADNPTQRGRRSAFYRDCWREKARTGAGATGRALTHVLRAGACTWRTPAEAAGTAPVHERSMRREVT